MKSATQEISKNGYLSYGLYKIYRKRFTRDDSKCEAAVTYNTWLRICRIFNQKKMQSIINGYIFNLPYRMGSIGVIQYKKKIYFDKDGNLLQKGLTPDWNKTHNLWLRMYPDKTKEEIKEIKKKPIVYMTNEHTDGRTFKFVWKKRNSNIKNLTAYKFIPSLKMRKALGRKIMENSNIQYCEKF